MKLTKEDKVAIHCPTLELAEKVNEKLAKELEVKKVPEDILKIWLEKSTRCLGLSISTGQVIDGSDKDWWEKHNYTIIPAEEYLNEKQLIDYLSIGDRVYSITKGWGEVIDLNKEYEVTSIRVKYNYDDIYHYNGNGKYFSSDLYPELYLEEVKLPKQELPEFKKGDLVWVSDNQNVWSISFYIKKIHNGHIVSLNNDLSHPYSVDYCKPFNEIQISK